MDFDKTSFSVDWFTPGDKYAPKRLSFPKSACISIDDLVPGSPLSLCFSPVDAAIPKPRPPPLVDTQFVPPDSPCDHGTSNGTEWRSLASPGVLSLADDYALCGVDLDVSCLDALDEQLLLSPVQCFSEMCWAAAVREEVTAPVSKSPLVSHTRTRSRTRSFKCDYERAFAPPFARDYPGSFERSRPLAARIALPLGVQHPHYVSTSPDPSCEPHDTSPLYKEKSTGYFPDIDPEGRFLPLPDQAVPAPRRSKKRDHAPTPPSGPRAPHEPTTARVQPFTKSLISRFAVSRTPARR